jgi:hypothetical protein
MGRPITGGHKFIDLPLMLGMKTRLASLLCKKKVNVEKSEEVKIGWFNSRRNRQVWQNVLRKAMAKK